MDGMLSMASNARQRRCLVAESNCRNLAPPSPLRSLTCVWAPRAQLLSDRIDASRDAVRHTQSVERMIKYGCRHRA